MPCLRRATDAEWPRRRRRSLSAAMRVLRSVTYPDAQGFRSCAKLHRKAHQKWRFYSMAIHKCLEWRMRDTSLASLTWPVNLRLGVLYSPDKRSI